MGDNQSNSNILDDKNRIVLEEINRWGRTINNIVWIVTSFFITLNFLIIRSTFSKDISYFIMNNTFLLNLLLIFSAYLLLWIIPFLFVLSMIVISQNLFDLFYYDSLKIRNLKSKLSFKPRRDKKKLCELIIKPCKSIKYYPWTWILFALTVFLFFIWVWILFTLN